MPKKKELSEEIMLEALLKGMKPLKIDCLPRRNRCGSRQRKTEVELLHVDEELQAEIIAAYNSDLQKQSVEEKLAR